MAEELRFGPACEVWLTQKNLEIRCMVVREDETTEELDADQVDSLSLRGAQREMTGWMLATGYQPAGRWQDARGPVPGGGTWADEPTEVVRKFKAS